MTPSESFAFPFQRVLAGTARMPLSLRVASELGFHPWPGPRDAGWFSPAEEAVLFVSTDGPVASASVRVVLEKQAKMSLSCPSFESVLLAGGGNGLGVSGVLFSTSLGISHPASPCFASLSSSSSSS